MSNNKLFLILGNQLFNPKLYFENILEYDFFMCEDYELCNYVKHHKLKILHVLSAMRSYKDELTQLGLKVHYHDIEKKNFKEDFLVKLKRCVTQNNYKKVYFFEIEDKFFESKLKTLSSSIEIEILPSPMFLFTRIEFSRFLESNKKLLMANFYKLSRKKNNILVKDNKPVANKWSFDDENRKKLPKVISIPKFDVFKKTKHTQNLSKIVNKIFYKNVGEVQNFWLPTDRDSCLNMLNEFLKKKFNLFGDYEDALSSKHDFIFHSVLSPIINMGLLTPSEIINKIKPYENKIKINSYEGFIRQIIGWREFIRGTYQSFDKEFSKRNYFQNNRKMKKSWYEGKTGIPPLDNSIRKAIRIGWNHHIERLMVIANIMNLSRINPIEVYKWFMEYYVDSYDWVMKPNVYGMGLFSDGGIFSTKPYICASSYLLKMSDYKKGKWTDIVDGLYWKFVDDHREKLKGNPRIGIMTKIIDNMNKDRRNKIFLAADNFLDEHTLLE